MHGFDLDAAIRKVPGFPKPGILFYDITSILTNPAAFSYCVEMLAEHCREMGPTALAAIEARGFIFGAAVAYVCRLPLIPIRKRGKLPGKTVARSFLLEYGEDVIEVHEDDIPVGGNIVVLDDLIATGGTVRAACDLFGEKGARITGITAVVGLPFLKYADRFPGIPIKTLIDYFED